MKLGIFGLIGSGKTTAVDYLKETYNFQILDLDKISKIVMDDEKAISFIRNSFPEAYDLKNQTIDRSKLREVLFTNKKKNKQFAAVIWPEIEALTNEVLSRIPNDKNVVIEGAMLPILNLNLDKMILIETKNKETIFHRVTDRDHRKIAETKVLLKIQKSWIKKANFDSLIKNDSTKEVLFLKLDKLMAKYEIKKMH